MVSKSPIQSTMLKWMRLRYDRASLALRRGHALIRYQTNLLKYNIDTLISDIKYGRRRSSAQVPFMITQKMHKQLEGLGYTSAQIKQLDPSRAHSAIQGNIAPTVLFAQPLPSQPTSTKPSSVSKNDDVFLVQKTKYVLETATVDASAAVASPAVHVMMAQSHGGSDGASVWGETNNQTIDIVGSARVDLSFDEYFAESAKNAGIRTQEGTLPVVVSQTGRSKGTETV
eukprot:comp15027_c0_seq1/m.11647 comp15027_c0_seq1/g.11647  ORF comp15027_c0_seq1/g.11647 comp15027_c0_seq1/m.11647 type:complete len:228 (-) comp15027_c0_seq1:284-967(-)